MFHQDREEVIGINLLSQYVFTRIWLLLTIL